MAVCIDFDFLSSDGKTQIHAVSWQPDSGVRAVVQISHGIAEHIMRYDDFARFLCDSGIMVVGHDHRGHGKSLLPGSAPGYWGETAGWELAVSDIRRLFELTRARYTDVPYFLFGHSMGSFLARTYIIRYPSGLAGVVLSGTGQQSPLLLSGGLAAAALEIRRHGAAFRSDRLQQLAFGKYNDGIKDRRTGYDWLSRKSSAVDAYISDPLCGFTASAGMLRDMFEGIRFISARRNLERMDRELPVFFISGDRDPVGENGRGVIRAYRAFLSHGMADASVKLYHGARHELLNEVNSAEVYADVLNWTESKM